MTRTPSLFSALFEYAKASRARAVENYTTEALAGAIRLSPEPFMAWLAAEQVLGAAGRFDSVETQRHEDEGILDMVLHTAAGGQRHRLIIEIKVDAGQTGDQMTRYSVLAERWSGIGISCPPPVVLSRASLGTTHRHLSWHGLRRHLDSWAPVDPIWQEFSRYLSDRHLSDRHDDPMTTEEVSTLGPSFTLFGKMTRVIHEALEELRKHNATFREFADWYPRGESAGRPSIRSQLGYQITNHGRLVAYPKQDGRLPVLTVFIGAWGPPHSAAPEVGVWIETDPRYDDLRVRVMREAQECGLTSAGWQQEHRAGKWRLVSSAEPLPALADGPDGNASVRGALVRRVEELHRTGMLDVILRHWRDQQVLAGEDATDE